MVPLIRPLGPGDLDAVCAIEEASYPFPWTRGIFEGCLRAGYAAFGLLVEGELAGYAISNWGAGESHLLNLCVHPRWRRHGFGRTLLEYSVAHARALDCHVMFLEVRPSNTDAGRLYRQFGFSEIGMRPAYYQAEGGREDALLMRLDLLAETGKAGARISRPD